MPYLKSTLETVWNEEPEILNETCRHRFRNDLDVNQYIFRYWRLAAGEFVPHAPLGRYVNMSDNNSSIYDAVRHRKYKLMCINDKENNCDFDTEKEKMTAAFEAAFPEKSEFEK